MCIRDRYLSRAYHDAPRYCADIVSTQIKNDEVILKGEIPARCIQELSLIHIWEKSKEIIGQIRQTYDPGMEYRLIQKYNSYVMGVHNYYSLSLIHI